jgi:hypothetical protein
VYGLAAAEPLSSSLAKLMLAEETNPATLVFGPTWAENTRSRLSDRAVAPNPPFSVVQSAPTATSVDEASASGTVTAYVPASRASRSRVDALSTTSFGCTSMVVLSSEKSFGVSMPVETQENTPYVPFGSRATVAAPSL